MSVKPCLERRNLGDSDVVSGQRQPSNTSFHDHMLESAHAGNISRLWTGSYNRSGAAEGFNDENIAVLEGVNVAGMFEQEFYRLWSTAG
ncbi:MAG: hypothetical protein QXR26_07280 [Candidatus Caldarchaeum sp.]